MNTTTATKRNSRTLPALLASTLGMLLLATTTGATAGPCINFSGDAKSSRCSTGDLAVGSANTRLKSVGQLIRYNGGSISGYRLTAHVQVKQGGSYATVYKNFCDDVTLCELTTTVSLNKTYRGYVTLTRRDGGNLASGFQAAGGIGRLAP